MLTDVNDVTCNVCLLFACLFQVFRETRKMDPTNGRAPQKKNEAVAAVQYGLMSF